MASNPVLKSIQNRQSARSWKNSEAASVSLMKRLKAACLLRVRVLSQESLKACAAKRPAVLAAVKRQLLGLREVEKANRDFRRIRDGSKAMVLELVRYQ
jgi:hypothetical protein